MRQGFSGLLGALTALFMGLMVVAAAAQDTSPAAVLDTEAYASWDSLATRAEGVVDRGLASSAALEVLRGQLTDWRARFREGQSAQSARLTTLREQIAALGPAPEEGLTEPAEISQRRAELEEQLRVLEAPILTATEAFQRADGLIGEVDQIIAARQTEALFGTAPSIVNPANWLPAVTAIGVYGGHLIHEAQSAYDTPSERTQASDNITTIGLYIIAALLLIFRAGPVLRRMQSSVLRRTTGPWMRIVHFALSLGRLALPVLGLIAVARALEAAGLSGLRASALIEALPFVGFVVLAARWLGELAFPVADNTPALIALDGPQRAKGRSTATLLGLLLAVAMVLGVIGNTGEDVAGYISVLVFPVVLLAGLLLIRLGLMILRFARSVIQDADEPSFLSRALRLLAQGVILVGAVAPILSGVGFATAAEALIWPTVMSLGLLSLLAALQALVYDLYALLTRTADTAREALVPTLVVFCLGILSVPLFALIWGVRWATLTELWSGFLSGVSLGGTTISPANFITFAVVFSIGYTLTRLLQGVLRSSVLPKTKLDSGGKNAILSGTGYIGFFVAALVAITLAGIDLSGLAIVAGALSVGIGFGLQTIVSNFVSGIILLIERPIKLGDWISVAGVSGYVRDISVRSTRIETFDRQDVIVPNADLIAGVVTNYTLGNATGRVIVPVGVAYGTDTKRVEAILQEIAEAHPMVLLNPKPSVVFQGFGADSLDFEIRALLRDVNWMLSVKSDMNHEIAARFVAEGIEIPYAQRDIWIRNPEALTKPPEAT